MNGNKTKTNNKIENDLIIICLFLNKNVFIPLEIGNAGQTSTYYRILLITYNV